MKFFGGCHHNREIKNNSYPFSPFLPQGGRGFFNPSLSTGPSLGALNLLLNFYTLLAEAACKTAMSCGATQPEGSPLPPTGQGRYKVVRTRTARIIIPLGSKYFLDPGPLLTTNNTKPSSPSSSHFP